MKKFLALGLIAIAAIAVLATSFVYVQAGNNGNDNPGERCSFFETLSQEEQDALLAKKEEMRNFKEELRGLSSEEKHERIQEIKEEMEQWAEDNEIGPNFGFMKGPGRGFRKGFKGMGSGNYPTSE